MITVLDRYLGITVIRGALLALFVLVALSGFFALLGELGDLQNQYGLTEALLFTALTLPRHAYELFPTAVLLGSLLSLGGLAAGHELVVMRASGLSVGRVARAVLGAGLILVLLAAALGELLAPPGERYAQSMRSAAQTGFISMKSAHGFWARDGDSFVNIRRVLPGAHLRDITIYEFDQQRRLRTVVHAASAQYRPGGWLLQDIRQSSIATSGITTQALGSREWQSLLRPELLDVLSVDPEDLSAASLLEYIEYLEQNNLDSARYQLAFWIKIATPLASLVMLLLAVPFVFGPLRSANAGTRVLVGVMLGLVFYLVNQALNHVGLVYGLPPLLSALLPVALFALGGAYAVRRVS